MDAAVFVLAADPPVSVSGRGLLRRVARLPVTTEDSVRLGPEVGAHLDALFDGELREAAAAAIEPRGRERLAAVTVAADLKAELDVLRESAAELLDLDLAVPKPEGRLAESWWVLLQNRGGRRPDRAAARCRVPLARWRVRQADGQGAPAP